MPKLKWRKSPKVKIAHLHIRADKERLRRWHRAAARDQRSLTAWVTAHLDAIATCPTE